MKTLLKCDKKKGSTYIYVLTTCTLMFYMLSVSLLMVTNSLKYRNSYDNNAHEHNLCIEAITREVLYFNYLNESELVIPNTNAFQFNVNSTNYSYLVNLVSKKKFDKYELVINITNNNTSDKKIYNSNIVYDDSKNLYYATDLIRKETN